MKISEDELVELLDELCSEISRVVASHAVIADELKEDMLDDRREDDQATKIDRIKKELQQEKDRLSQLRQRQRHKRDVLKKRKEHERQRRAAAKQPHNEGNKPDIMTPLRNERGNLIGWIQRAEGGKTNILDRKGHLIARELNGIIMDATGQLRGRGRQGFIVLGRTLAA